MSGGGALAARITGFRFSGGSFSSASRLSRDGRKNSRKEVPKSRFYRDCMTTSKYALRANPTSKHALNLLSRRDKTSLAYVVKIMFDPIGVEYHIKFFGYKGLNPTDSVLSIQINIRLCILYYSWLKNLCIHL